MSSLIGKDVVSLFVVEQRVGEDAWEKCVQWVSGLHQNGNDMDAIKAAIKQAEKECCDYFNIKGLPVAWRTAKSTALGAIANGVPLVALNGEIVPKTTVGHLIKAKKAISAPAPVGGFKEWLDKFNAVLDGAQKALLPHDYDSFLNCVEEQCLLRRRPCHSCRCLTCS